MAEKTVRVALWEYTTEDGLRHRAFFGDVVDIPESEIERGEKANVFGDPSVFDIAPDEAVDHTADLTADVPDEAVDHTADLTADVPDEAVDHTADLTADVPDAPAVVVGNRPKLAAPKPVWETYATKRGIKVDGLDKDEIIAEVDALDKK